MPKTVGAQMSALVGVLLLLAPATALAQASQCHLPRFIQSPRAITPRAGESRPNIPVAGYTLALSWSPEYCAGQYNPRGNSQCNGSIGTFGFILHGLWPEGYGNSWPQYCRAAPVIPREVIAQNLCVTPSSQLMQHEWAKHGTCIAADPKAYLDQARIVYQRVRFPDMAALSRDRGLTVGKLVNAFAAINPGLKPNMLRVGVNHGTWLDEVSLCLDRQYAPAACPSSRRGMRTSAPLRIRFAQ